MDRELLITIGEACRMLGCDSSTLKKLRQPGKAFAELRPVTDRMFYRKQFEALLDKYTGMSDPEAEKQKHFDNLILGRLNGSGKDQVSH